MPKTSQEPSNSSSPVEKLGEQASENPSSAENSALEKLAQHIARALDDEKNLGLYVSYCRRYPLEVIQYAFTEAKRRTAQEIKKSRGALFTYLVKLKAREKKKRRE